MGFIFKTILILIYFLVFINADSVNGPNYPTNYIVPISGQLNLPTNYVPVSQQSVAVNLNNGGVLTSENINQYLAGVNDFGTNGGIIAAGLNGFSGTNGLLTGSLGTNNGLINVGLNGLSGFTDIQTSEIIRRQIQTSNLNALNGGGNVAVVNPLGTTGIGANGLPISTINNALTTMNGLSAVIDQTTGATIGYVGANGVVTPVNAGINSLQIGYGNANNGYQVVNGPNAINTVIDKTTGVTIGYVGANGVVTPVTTTSNGIQTGYGNTLYPINNGYQSNGFNPLTGITGLNGFQNGYGNGLNGYQVINGPNGINIVIDQTTGATIGYVGANGVVTPVNAGINSLQTGYGNGFDGINPLQLGNLYPPTGIFTNQGIMNGLPNTGLNPYNSYQNGYGSLYPTTMGTGLPGMNGYPYANGINNVMNPYYGQQFGYNGNPFTGQLQYPGYPINGNSGSNSQASASSKSF